MMQELEQYEQRDKEYKPIKNKKEYEKFKRLQ